MPRLADPATVPGLPESRLSNADLARLPTESAVAPWRCRTRALVWYQRARHPAFEWSATTLPLVIVAFVDYEDTPVGPYQGVLAAAAVRRGRRVMGQVPFIAVNSLPSVHGGRANWALPKTTATFRGGVADGAVTARGDGWSVTAHAARRGPEIPMRSSAWQTGPLGDYHVHLRAKGRPVLVDSSAVGPTLTPWLGAGRHLGMSIAGEMIVGPPQAA
jgi:Acetoacetate decarboxylase (ADC)